MFVTLLGRPGAGKTTLGRNLSRATGLPYLGGGTLLRRYVVGRRTGWREVARNLENRTDNPADLQIKVLLEGLKDAPKGAFLDGFPKTLDLAARVDASLPAPIDLAIHLDVPAEVAEVRVRRRLICSVCSMPTTASSHTLDDPCVFDDCGGVLVRRPEDDAAGETRQRESLDSVALSEHFHQRGDLLVIEAGLSPEAAVSVSLDELRRRGLLPSQTGQ